MAKREGVRAAREAVPAVLEASPDVLGRDGRVNVLVGLLTKVQAGRFELEAVQIANGHAGADPVAGRPSLREDGQVNSYLLNIAELSEQERRLAEAFPDVIDRVRELVARRS